MLKTLFLALLSITCLNRCSAANAETKRCVFSIEVIRDGRGLKPQGYTAIGDGIFLYEHPDGQITGERYQQWDIQSGAPRDPQREIFGSGKAFSQTVRDLFKKSAVGEVDFQAEMLAAEQAATQHAISTGKVLPVTVSSGRTVRIYADLEGTRFTFSVGGLSAVLRLGVDHNEKLKALKALLDGIAYEYGRSRVFID